MNAVTTFRSAAAASSKTEAGPAQRLSRSYRFADADMDLFFMAAMGWGPAGGLDIGQLMYIADTIEDGNADSWVDSFAAYGAAMDAQADAWLARGHRRIAGETRLKAFASYRSAWQFAGPTPRFAELVGEQRIAFAKAMVELDLPASFFAVPWQGRKLPGVHLRHADPQAPLALVIGGADTSYDDLFLTIGRNLLDRGYSVAMVDLPGQGVTEAEGLYWEAEAEKPIAAAIDLLVRDFGAEPGRVALIGLSLGGYFVARAAGHETRLATVIASTPFPSPAELFRLSVEAALAHGGGVAATQAAQCSRAVTLWKAGATNPAEFLANTAGFVADPKRVTVPFLSILGTGDSPVFAAQAEHWDREIASARKRFVRLDAASGADGHVQVNNRLRLAQECAAWMDEIFGRAA